jgi:hypothetical protein
MPSCAISKHFESACAVIKLRRTRRRSRAAPQIDLASGARRSDPLIRSPSLVRCLCTRLSRDAPTLRSSEARQRIEPGTANRELAVVRRILYLAPRYGAKRQVILGYLMHMASRWISLSQKPFQKRWLRLVRPNRFPGLPVIGKGR